MLEGLDTLVLDMLRLKHHPTHLHRDQAVEIAKKIGATQTWFTHMTHCIEHQQIDASLPERINLAYDCLRI
jgi:phosphoribosyl 1,2-cyclic phosphate phosphodiesterase